MGVNRGSCYRKYHNNPIIYKYNELHNTIHNALAVYCLHLLEQEGAK